MNLSARLAGMLVLKDNGAIGHGKNISAKATAEIIKEYGTNSLAPAFTGEENQPFT